MFRCFNHIWPLLAAISLMLVGGCSSKEYLGDASTADLRLSVPMLENITRAGVEGTEKENEIYTLRVLIVDKDNKVLHNVRYTKDQLSDLIIEKIPVGTVQFWVIANEASVGMDYDNDSWTVETVNGVKKLRVNDPDRKYFPKRESVFLTENLGLPMSWGSVVEVLPSTGQPQVVKVELVRNVSKIIMSVTHSYNSPISLTNVSFGPFMSDCLYMFKHPDQNIPDVPADASYSSMEYGEALGSSGFPIELPGITETKALTIYVYPSFPTKPEEPYTLGFESSLGKYPEKPILDKAGKIMTNMNRNTVLNINVIISENDLSIGYKVSEWGSETIDVPDFN